MRARERRRDGERRRTARCDTRAFKRMKLVSGASGVTAAALLTRRILGVAGKCLARSSAAATRPRPLRGLNYNAGVVMLPQAT